MRKILIWETKIIQMEKEELLDENREKKSAEGSRNKRLCD